MRLLLRDGRFTLSTIGWVVITFIVSYSLSFRYFHYVSSRDPSSYFFDPKHAYEKKYSAVRTEQAKTLIEAANAGKLSKSRSKEPPYLCIGVATVARRGDQLAHLTVGSLLSGLSTEERTDIHIDLLLGHTDPSKHPMASDPWLRVLPDRMLRYDPAGPDWLQIQAWEEGGWYRNKTIYDYTYLLRNCYDTGAKYVAILEDDTLAVEGWFSRLRIALNNVEAAMQPRAKTQRWLYLRLFYTDDLLGWNSEEWPKYLFLSTLFWLSVTTACLVLKGRYKRVSDSQLTNSGVIGLSTIGCTLIVALHFLAGRHTTHPISPGIHEMNKYGCCSQGLTYPRTIIPDLLAHTDLTTDWLADMMIEKIADQEGWIRWATVPPLLQHIGATSSKGYGFDDNAKKLWSFRFEDWKI